MERQPIIISDHDHKRLRELIAQARQTGAADERCLNDLERELDRATVVEPGQVPPDVVTMNSMVRVRADGSPRSWTWTIVYPEDADMDENRVSILEPMGTALIGYRAGDEVEWDVPAGKRRYRIAEVLRQPEPAGETGA